MSQLFIYGTFSYLYFITLSSICDLTVISNVTNIIVYLFAVINLIYVKLHSISNPIIRDEFALMSHGSSTKLERNKVTGSDALFDDDKQYITRPPT